MKDTVTHLAGPCLNCGNSMGVSPFPTWAPGRLVRMSVGANPASFEMLDDPPDSKLPDDACIDLVE